VADEVTLLAFKTAMGKGKKKSSKTDVCDKGASVILCLYIARFFCRNGRPIKISNWLLMQLVTMFIIYSFQAVNIDM
jgi:hypothetical protein